MYVMYDVAAVAKVLQNLGLVSIAMCSSHFPLVIGALTAQVSLHYCMCISNKF